MYRQLTLFDKFEDKDIPAIEPAEVGDGIMEIYGQRYSKTPKPGWIQVEHLEVGGGPHRKIVPGSENCYVNPVDLTGVYRNFSDNENIWLKLAWAWRRNKKEPEKSVSMTFLNPDDFYLADKIVHGKKGERTWSE